MKSFLANTVNMYVNLLNMYLCSVIVENSSEKVMAVRNNHKVHVIIYSAVFRIVVLLLSGPGCQYPY